MAQKDFFPIGVKSIQIELNCRQCNAKLLSENMTIPSPNFNVEKSSDSYVENSDCLICDKCKEEYKLPEKYIKEIKENLEENGLDYVSKLIPDFDINKMKFYKGKGCSHCGNTGYHGRLSVSEAMTITNELKEKIFEGKKHLTLEDIRASQQFVSVKQDGILKVIQGITTMEEVLRVMRD